MSNEYADVSPNPLPITLSRDSKEKITTSLTLKNNSNNYLLYKFLINTRGILQAKPSTSFIPPSKTISVDVNLLNNNLPLEDYNNTKLLIMFIKSNEEIQNIDHAKKMFNSLKNEEIEKQEILVKLNIFDTNNNDNGGEEEEDNDNNNNNNVIMDKNEKEVYVNYSQVKAELTNNNNEIRKNLEIQRKKLENLMGQENKYNNNLTNSGKRKKSYNLDNLIFAFLILFGLIAGANFAQGYNKLFKK